MRDGILCSQCPVCGAHPAYAFESISPWFCPMEDCKVLAWDPFATALTNLQNAGHVIELDNTKE